MSMADLFPDAFKKNHIDEKKLAVGNVLYLHCDFTTPPKVKYLVVCCCNPLLGKVRFNLVFQVVTG